MSRAAQLMKTTTTITAIPLSELVQDAPSELTNVMDAADCYGEHDHDHSLMHKQKVKDLFDDFESTLGEDLSREERMTILNALRELRETLDELPSNVFIDFQN